MTLVVVRLDIMVQGDVVLIVVIHQVAVVVVPIPAEAEVEPTFHLMFLPEYKVKKAV